MKTDKPKTPEEDLRNALEELQLSGIDPKLKTEIVTLARTQHQLGMNHTEFTRGCSIDATTWSRVRRGKYTGNIARVVTEMKRHVKNLFEKQRLRERRGELNLNNGDFIEFAEYTALREATAAALEASDRGGENKLVVYVAPSGGGKTTVGKQLVTAEGFNAVMITGRPSWASSYFPALMAVAKALGVSDGLRTASEAEAAVLEKMSKDKGLLVVNEVELLCRQVRHLFRCILNETEWAVVLLVTPQGYRYLAEKPSSDSAQLLRRCESIITASEITPAQVQKFLEGRWPLDQALRAGSIEIAKAANAFGAFDFIVRVVELLADAMHGTGESPSLELIEKKITAARKAVPLVHSTRTAA